MEGRKVEQHENERKNGQVEKGGAVGEQHSSGLGYVIILNAQFRLCSWHRNRLEIGGTLD